MQRFARGQKEKALACGACCFLPLCCLHREVSVSRSSLKVLTAAPGALMSQYEPALTHPRPQAGGWMVEVHRWTGGRWVDGRSGSKPFSVVLREGKQVQKLQCTWEEEMPFSLPRDVPSDLRPQSKHLLILQRHLAQTCLSWLVLVHFPPTPEHYCAPGLEQGPITQTGRMSS